MEETVHIGHVRIRITLTMLRLLKIAKHML